MRIVSWRTTALGVAGIVYIALKAAVIPLLDDDPATVVNIREVIDALLNNGEVILLALGLGVARDNVVSSQQVGIRPDAADSQADAAIARSRR